MSGQSTGSRRNFIKKMGVGLAAGGLTLGFPNISTSKRKRSSGQQTGNPVGVIGLDTSHAPRFTEMINNQMEGYQVVAAYPHGSSRIESSYSRIPEYTKKFKEMGVDILDSVEAVLDRVDYVLLETNDGGPHLRQAQKIFEAGIPAFIDKPLSDSLVEAIGIFEAAEQHGVRTFTSSSLRFSPSPQAARNGEVGDIIGADTYSPATLEPTHPDMFWYGIHGIEMLYTVMGPGCETVQRTYTEGTEHITGRWKNGRIGTFRGLREGDRGYGGTAFGSDDMMSLSYEGYQPLVEEIINFFETGEPPISREETIELYAFMEAADQSRRMDGATVELATVIKDAEAEAAERGLMHYQGPESSM